MGSKEPPWQVVGVPGPYCSQSVFFLKTRKNSMFWFVFGFGPRFPNIFYPFHHVCGVHPSLSLYRIIAMCRIQSKYSSGKLTRIVSHFLLFLVHFLKRLVDLPCQTVFPTDIQLKQDSFLSPNCHLTMHLLLLFLLLDLQALTATVLLPLRFRVVVADGLKLTLTLVSSKLAIQSWSIPNIFFISFRYKLYPFTNISLK